MRWIVALGFQWGSSDADFMALTAIRLLLPSKLWRASHVGCKAHFVDRLAVVRLRF